MPVLLAPLMSLPLRFHRGIVGCALPYVARSNLGPGEGVDHPLSAQVLSKTATTRALPIVPFQKHHFQHGFHIAEAHAVVPSEVEARRHRMHERLDLFWFLWAGNDGVHDDV